MKAAKSVLIIGFIVVFFLVCLVSYAENTPEGIVLFDQSGSMKKCDPELRSKALIVEFIRSLKKPHRIVLAGFNEEIHEYITLVTATETDVEALAGEIQRIDARSLCTDLETPFRYLLERESNEDVKFVFIISDGEPDIWDGKLRYFSKRVKSDPRYEDLNRQYHMLKASGLSPDELFERLKHLYDERNLELIEEQVFRLKDGLGDRIILWDLSGESGYFRTWAEECGGLYLPMKAEEGVTTVDRLINVTLSVPGRSNSIVREPLPEDHETHPESALPAALEPEPVEQKPVEPEIEIGLEPETQTAAGQRPERAYTTVTSQPASPDLGDEPKKPAGQTRKQISGNGVGGWAITAALALFVLGGVGCMTILWRSRKKAARAERKKKLEVEVETEIGKMKEQGLAEMEAEVAAQKEKRMQDLEKELAEQRKSGEQEVKAEKKRRMRELEARESEMVSTIEANSVERKRELEAELEAEIGKMKEQGLAEMEAEVAAEKEKMRQGQGLVEMEAEVAAEKEKRMQEFEAQLAEYWKSVEQEIEAEKERRMQELEARESEMVSSIEAKSAERKKKLEVELEAEIGRMKEQGLAEMEAGVATEIGRMKEQRLVEMEAEVAAEKENRMQEFEAQLAEYWKSVEVEVEAEKGRKKG